MASGGLRSKSLGTKAQRQESAAQGAGGNRRNLKMHPKKGQRTPGNVNLDNSTPGGPVTIAPNPAKLIASQNGSKSPRKAR